MLFVCSAIIFSAIFLQGKPGGVPEKVFGHFDGRPVVGDHLDDEIVGNAVCQGDLCHAGDHRVEDLPVSRRIYWKVTWLSFGFRFIMKITFLFFTVYEGRGGAVKVFLSLAIYRKLC